MHKVVITVVIVVVGIFAIASPIAFTLYHAHKLALDSETALALTYARDVLRRTEDTADQIESGFTRLLASTYEPCSDEQIALMRRIDLSSSYIQTIGYTHNDQLICSSLGLHNTGLPLGPIDGRAANGNSLRADVSFDFAPKTSFVVSERNNYAVIIHKDLPVDISTARDDTILAVYWRVNGELLTSRGKVKPEWLNTTSDNSAATFINNGYIVAVVHSKRYFTSAVAAIPTTYLEQEVHDISLRLVPVGLLGGLIFALVIWYLARQQLALPAVIRSALKRNEFFLVYQPVVDLYTGQWVGAEALIRWKRSSGEMVRPDVFIPVAEEAGLIQRITHRVLEIAERDAGDLFRRFPNFHLAINLSPQDLHAQDSVDLILNLAKRLKAGPNNLIMEATEHGFIKPEVARGVVRQFRNGGVRTAIDDFGTGYSSLAYLETFELDFLKIDKSFVDTIGVETATSHVVPHIIEMAKALNLQLIAEGVETEKQAQYLREHKVQYAQGWLYARPMPMSELVARLSSNK